MTGLVFPSQLYLSCTHHGRIGAEAEISRSERQGTHPSQPARRGVNSPFGIDSTAWSPCVNGSIPSYDCSRSLRHFSHSLLYLRQLFICHFGKQIALILCQPTFVLHDQTHEQ